MNDVTPVRPYLIRAFYEWIIDNNLTPYISVDTTNNLARVPKQYIQNDQIVLDIAPYSVRELLIDNEALSCQAMFDNELFNLYVPIPEITAIFAQENGQGMAFPKEKLANEASQDSTPKAKKPQLKIIDGEK